MKKEIQKQNWYLLTIDDPTFLSSNAVAEAINELTKILTLKFAIIDDIEGHSTGISPLVQIEKMILSINELLLMIRKVENFEWGDFFLFKEKPVNWDCPEKCNYPYLVAQTNTTLRAVDNQFIYIYTPHIEVVEGIKNKYNLESFTQDCLEYLEYPY